MRVEREFSIERWLACHVGSPGLVSNTEKTSLKHRRKDIMEDFDKKVTFKFKALEWDKESTLFAANTLSRFLLCLQLNSLSLSNLLRNSN